MAAMNFLFGKYELQTKLIMPTKFGLTMIGISGDLEAKH